MTDLIKQKTKTLQINNLFNYGLMALVMAAALSYMYFANIAVRNLTVLEKTRKQIQSLNIEVSEKESQRLSIENSVSTEKAISLGFVEVRHPTFIVKNSKKTALSLKID
ncbi:MAG: hypothetical protein UR50_C0008G0018 [Parcubacteria group bacterium GW2011_GWC1_34_10]|uniref:Cell division protein FtsL n=1 Tax=Candidatus Zambryskibacteria bacterium RIFCSPLOWO2_01_FULL_35_19 TaxID=1802757 RepID=A0A1G2TYG4_9BACT|nr:MAG: hypothetical protein UR50_C0008G0018 [Parcubacteria group bacterium GW2011_GWC1_34_10]OHA86203.1 MAG: hypothetical protein A2726_01745 [Candidatus Zambryskibacteria bacterium RIFCSPHIGHO2_01_FULL_35_32]OHB02213.1 MAG: hypothetical protein A3A90_02595 [Candidatus Zambryskibacteria bacterium RIFCSPLOWO2_01_FULL_35_19]